MEFRLWSWLVVLCGAVLLSPAQQLPTLRILQDAGNVRISWLAPTADFALQQSVGSDSALAWGLVGAEVYHVAGLSEVVVPIIEGQQFFRLVSPPAPADMSLIPAGAFQMGDTFNEGLNEVDINSELPLHSVFVSAYYIGRNLVTREEWESVYIWALGHGYALDHPGDSFKPANHPVHSINWYDMVKWCNARSEKEGLTPCYYSDATQMAVYKTGNLDLVNASVNWTANGYRLPTEAEWEKAARGGRAGNRFPWGDTISHAQANYYSSSDDIYDVNDYEVNLMLHPSYSLGAPPFTSPVGSFEANDYGLFDIAGNLYQWCWDRHDDSPYGSAEPASDPHGLDTKLVRVARGGSWFSSAVALRCSARFWNEDGNAIGKYYIGFRCVRAH